MSVLLLERLSKKTTQKMIAPVEIKFEKGQVPVDDVLVDRRDGEYNVSSFRERLKKHRLSVPKLPEPSIEILKVEKVEGEEDEETPKKIKKKIKLPGDKRGKIKKKTKKPIEEIILDIPATLIQVDDRPIGSRLPKKEPSINIKASSYFLNNREYFINFINSLFRKYGKQLEQDSATMTCDSLNKSKSKSFSLMTHQQIVKEYINIYSPYRGLLLYHGLGAGKTCASIAIAEGMKDTNQVIVMTPASLRMNYLSELKHCGDPIYKINQYWEKVQTTGNPHLEKALSEVLNLPVSYIRKQGWVWMVDVTKASNFESLNAIDQKSIDGQINEMMLKKYKFINYNGWRNKNLDDLIKEATKTEIPEEYYEEEEEEEEGEEEKTIKRKIDYDRCINDNKCKNPFDDKVIIIDEAHNFVSRIVNKLKSKKKGLAIRLYELLLSATNCRIIFLTGTPIINYPNEIAVLFNILRGYIKTFYLKIDTSETDKTINQQYILDIFKKEKLLDYVEYSAANTTLTITRNPLGFVNRQKRTKSGDIEYGGVSKKDAGLKNDSIFLSFVIKTLKKHNINVVNPKRESKIKNYKALPDTLESFRDLFIDNVTGEMKEVNLFKRRILGLTSYFRSAQESLLPTYEEIESTHIEKIPMSDYQLGVYEKARSAERKEEDRNSKSKAKQQEGVYADTTSTYRIFSRAFCNFVFPNEIDEETNVLITRPMPKTDQTIEQAISTKRTLKEKKTGVGEKDELDEDIIDGAELQDKLDNRDGLYARDDAEQIEKKVKQQVDSSYKVRIKQAINLLKKNGDKYLSPRGLKITTEAGKIAYTGGLQKYGPKFLRVLENIKNPANEGLHLIYSQFRTLEGVGILSLIFEQNGFARFKITKNTGVWKLDMPSDDFGKPKYALYTGTESAEEKEIIRNIFNGSWDSVPSTLSVQLKETNNNNNLGEIIKVLMITSSGSEGITLKNTRFVHLIEPYWHPVRTEQVIGRARRICSHKDLPEKLRTVEVFIYLMTFTEIQMNGDKNASTVEGTKPIASKNLLKSKTDKSKIDRITHFTSDETLFEISNIKKTTNTSILRAIKSSSIDCNIHRNSNKKEGVVCYSFGAPSVNTFSYRPDYSSEEDDAVEAQNLKGITWTGYPIKIEGMNYVIKRTDSHPSGKIGEIYDIESYYAAEKDARNPPIQLGRTRINPAKPGHIQFLKVGDPDF